MGKGLIVFLLIVVVSAIIGAVSQMMKNAQAPPPPARRGRRPQQTGDEIDKFLEEIDRLRKKKESDADGPPTARPVARPARGARPQPPARPATAADRAPTHRVRASEGAAFVPSKVTRRSSGPSRSLMDVDPAASMPTPVDDILGGTMPRLEDLPAAAPIRPSATAGIDKDNLRPEQSEFAKTLVALLTGKHGLPMAVAMQEILNPPKSKRRGRPPGGSASDTGATQ